MNITIALDAKFDLSQAGYGRSENMIDAYSAAAAFIAEQSGIEIDIVEAPYESPEAFAHRIEEGEVGDFLWQAIHDTLRRDANGHWTFDESKASVVARRLKSSVPA